MHVSCSSMDEKTLVEDDDQQEQQQQQIIISSPSPPSYYSTAHTPPPPTYLQPTTRLYYKNQPYISELDEVAYRQEQEERQLRDNQSDTWSEIGRLSLHRRFSYYMTSWGNTVYDGRLIFFSFFIFASFTIMVIVVSVIVIPSLVLKR